MPLVSFQNIDVKPAFKEKLKLKQFIPHLFNCFGLYLDSLTIIFCSDEHLLSMNRQFLQHDYYTDILTFDLSSDKKSVSGEIYISIDRVRENAIIEEVTFQEELLRVIFHGILHLCGFKDKTIKQKKEMTASENDALVKFSLFHVKQ